MIKWLFKHLRKFHNEDGFTLIELIITISIVAIAAGISGFGLNSIFDAQVDGMAHDIASDLRNIRFRTVSEFDTAYQMVLTYDASSDEYGYKIYSYTVGDSGLTEFKSVDYNSSLKIYREDSSGSWIELNDSTIAIQTNSENGTFTYDPADGGIATTVLNDASKNVNSLNLNGGDLGRFKIVSTRNNDEILFDVVGFTGRVVIYD